MDKRPQGAPLDSPWRRGTVSHTCHWPGCQLPVPARLWGCKRHWFLLPVELRDAIGKYYVRGQEWRKDPSPEYILIAKLARTWAEDYEIRNHENIHREVER